MITRQSDKSLKQSQTFDSHSFGIKESGLSHIFNVLRNQLYSDKVLAVIREYSTNAVDAHIESGKRDVPIRVTLPNQLKTDFRIRDFGRGLTEKQISQVYAMYGESTKRGSNEQIGQLGLGCKSAFAYGDNFVINSFVNGTKTTYNAFIDPSDIGQISKMEEKKTSQKDGIEIVIPVRSEDVREFHIKAFQLYKFFEVIPEIHGADKEEVSKETQQSKVIVSEDNWKLVDGESYAIMGNIAYPLDENALNINWDSPLHELLNSGVEIVFNIGDLEISASREALQYTDRTKTTIMNGLNGILESLPEVLGRKFSECKSLWDAKVLYNEAFAHGGFGGKIKKIVDAKGIVWNGITIKNGTFDTSKWKDEDLELKAFTKPNSYGAAKRVKGNETNHIYCKEDSLVIVDDAATHHGRLNRIAPLIEEYEKQTSGTKYKTVYLINYRSGKAGKEFIDEQKFDVQTKKLSEYPKVILRDIYPSNSTVSGGSTVKNTKHSTKVFSLDEFCEHGSHHTCRSDFFESNEVDLDAGGVYVVVNKFFWGKNDCEEKHPYQLIKKIKAMSNAGILDIPTIYALKPTEKNMKAIESDKWVYFEDWAVETLRNFLGEYGHTMDLFHRICSEHHKRTTEHYDEYCQALLELNEKDDTFVDKLPPSLAKDYVVAYNEMLKKDNEELDNFTYAFKTIGKGNDDFNRYRYSSRNEQEKSERPNMRGILDHCWGDDYGWPEHDLGTMNKECQKRYKMISLMDDSYYRYSSREQEAMEATIQYITLVEATYNVKKNIQKQKQRIEDNIFLVAEKS